MLIEKEGVYRTRGGEFVEVRRWDNPPWNWLSKKGTHLDNGITRPDRTEDDRDLVAYVCPLQSIAPPEVHWQYREIGFRIREVGEVIQYGDYYNHKTNNPCSGHQEVDDNGLYAIGRVVDNVPKLYCLEPLSKPSPPMESNVTAVPQPQGTAEVAYEVGDVVVVSDGTMRLITTIDGEQVWYHTDTWSTLISIKRYATPAERRKFFAMNPTKHPAHRPEHGDMNGWRYLEIGEGVKDGDEFWNYYEHRWSNFGIQGDRDQNNSGHPYRRRVDSVGNDILSGVEPAAQPQPEPWKPTPGSFVSYHGYKRWYVGKAINNYAVLDVFEAFEEVDYTELSPWIDPPHAVAEFELNGTKFRAERWVKDEPVITKVEG